MKKEIILILILSIFFLKCNDNNLDIDISNININLKIKRLEKDLFENKDSNLSELIIFLQKKYGNFLELYNNRIIGIGSSNNKNYSIYLQRFLTYDLNLEVYKEIKKDFSNLENLKKNLENSFKHYKYHFPKKNIPEIYTFISGLQSYSIITDVNMLGIALDNYLGADYNFYKNIGIENYKIKNMYKEKIVSDCMNLWAKMEFPIPNSIEKLVYKMIYHGKILYFLDAMKTSEEDFIKIGFTKKEIQFCEENEKEMWTYMVENKLLFSSKNADERKFIKDSPFTNCFSKNSPGRTGIWIGWQIVKNYMKNNEEIKIENLMKENDFQKILRKSRYNP
ncbi:MAG: hypothetical protein B6I24_04530 [Bacteroidetes bacterium 4572_128]|nr:MAG: hypothetical protein B6I24_04530 [Bacteroidetes bacterium 4572_128]